MISGYVQRVVINVEMTKGKKKRKYAASIEEVSGSRSATPDDG